MPTTITINEDINLIITSGSSANGFNQTAKVFVKGESAPIFSRNYKETTPHSVIKIWATESTETLYHYERLDNM
jgi:ribosomal protein L30E